MKKNRIPTTSRRSFGASRLAVGVSAVAAGLALMLTPLGASGQVTADAESAITVVQTPSGGGDCVDPTLALTNGTLSVYPYSDTSVFRLSVHASAPLCSPLTAKATVYAMPANGDQWPQTLVESKTITIQEAGDTVITFAKACDRVQYDLVSGDVPAVLNTGFDHTLLFLGNLETAFQHVGNGPDCQQASTTAAPTTTAAVTTTTAAVLGSTTVAGPTTTIRSSVLAATTVPSGSSPNNAGLAVTGTTTSGPIALMGGGLVFMGVAFMLASRRRTA